MQDCITLLSGGMDSTTLLHYLVKKLNRKPIAISFDYGQRHSKELEFAKYHTEMLKLEHIIIDIPFYRITDSKSSLLNDNLDIPHEHYTHENQRITAIPNRNMVMVSIAVAIAEERNINEVYYACHANDYAIYPDCRPEFVDSISETAKLGTYNEVRVIAPFVKISKKDIARLGKSLNVDFDKTWSCYEGGDEPCRKCATCQERAEALEEERR